MNDFTQYYNTITSAKFPEDVFGNIDENELIEIFNKIAKSVHPDHNPADLKRANECFSKLVDFRAGAELLFDEGSYGKRNSFKPVVITTKKGSYTLYKLLVENSLYQIYEAKDVKENYFTVKIVNNARNNDLIDVERETLKFLKEEAKTKELAVMAHIQAPPIDYFQVDNRNALVFIYLDKYRSLQKVLDKYPAGIDMRDAAWMINRLLASLMVPSQAGFVHGNINPDSFLINPETHNGTLINWNYTVRTNKALKSVNSAYRSHYPAEVFSKRLVDSGMDLYMVAKLLILLTGGDITTNSFSNQVPKRIQGIFRVCLMGPGVRSKDPFEVYNEFNKELKMAFGPRKFRIFEM